MSGRENRARFKTTRWSLVLAAGETSSPERDNALTRLYETYWYPLYAFLRGQGQTREDAEDCVQAFFVHLLEKNAIRIATRERGRFRSFLLASLKNFATNEHDRAAARKRGGGVRPLSLEIERAEGRYRLDLPTKETPDVIFDRNWALALLDRAMERLHQEMDRSGDASTFESLKPYLTNDEPRLRTAQTARVLGMSEGAVRVAAHRMRRRFGQLLRDEVAHTVASGEDADEELKYLISVLR